MGAGNDKPRPSWAPLLLAAAGYVGLTPLLRLFRVRRGDMYLRHHQTQGLAAFPLLVLVLLIWPAYLLAETCRRATAFATFEKNSPKRDELDEKPREPLPDNELNLVNTSRQTLV